MFSYKDYKIVTLTEITPRLRKNQKLIFSAFDLSSDGRLNFVYEY